MPNCSTERIFGLVLCGIFPVRARRSKQWSWQRRQARAAAWQQFADAIPAAEHENLLAAYARRILGDNPAAAEKASRAWLNYGRALHNKAPLLAWPDHDIALATARLQLHYLQHAVYRPGPIAGRRRTSAPLLAGRHRAQGVADPLYPTHAAGALHRAWPEATWFPVANAGHDVLASQIARACIKAMLGRRVLKRLAEGLGGLQLSDVTVPSALSTEF